MFVIFIFLDWIYYSPPQYEAKVQYTELEKCFGLLQGAAKGIGRLLVWADAEVRFLCVIVDNIYIYIFIIDKHFSYPNENCAGLRTGKLWQACNDSLRTILSCISHFYTYY